MIVSPAVGRGAEHFDMFHARHLRQRLLGGGGADDVNRVRRRAGDRQQKQEDGNGFQSGGIIQSAPNVSRKYREIFKPPIVRTFIELPIEFVSAPFP
jgi:hypothetical protein